MDWNGLGSDWVGWAWDKGRGEARGEGGEPVGDSRIPIKVKPARIRLPKVGALALPHYCITLHRRLFCSACTDT